MPTIPPRCSTGASTPPADTLPVSPLRWLPATPTLLANDPAWENCLTGRAVLVAELADQIRETVTHQWTPATAPAWAKPVLAANPQLAAEIAVFRAAHNVVAEDTTLLGPPQYAVRARTIQNSSKTGLKRWCAPKARMLAALSS